MSTQHSYPVNPQRRERLVNLADFRRPASPEAAQPEVESSASHFPEPAQGEPVFAGTDQ